MKKETTFDARTFKRTTIFDCHTGEVICDNKIQEATIVDKEIKTFFVDRFTECIFCTKADMFKLRNIAACADKAIGIFTNSDKNTSALVRINKIWTVVVYDNENHTIFTKKQPKEWHPELMRGRWKYLAVSKLSEERKMKHNLRSITDHLLRR